MGTGKAAKLSKHLKTARFEIQANWEVARQECRYVLVGRE
jgi:hypothetical protein